MQNNVFTTPRRRLRISSDDGDFFARGLYSGIRCHAFALKRKNPDDSDACV